jgi:hypothetical protein
LFLIFVFLVGELNFIVVVQSVHSWSFNAYTL